MRKPNIKINGEALETAVKKAEGNRYNKNNISTIIIGKSASYFSQCIQKNTIESAALEKLCTFYDLDKEDFILTEEDEKAAVVKQVNNTNYENLLTLLTSIDKTLKELLAQEKSNQYVLNQVQDAILTGNRHSKSVMEMMQADEKRKQNHHSTMNKLRSV